MIDPQILKLKLDKIRLIGTDGKQRGIFSLKEAEAIAEEENVDLILVNGKQNPAVVKLGNYKLFVYQQEKKEKEIKKKTKELKEVRISFNEAIFDLQRKAKLIKEFLENSHQVQIRLNLKGREKFFFDLAEEKLNNFLKIIDELINYKVTQPIKKFSNFLSVIIAKN